MVVSTKHLIAYWLLFSLLDYFETMIGRMLLYKFEQPMFDKLKAKLEADADDENENAENIGNGIALHLIATCDRIGV